MKIYEKLLKIQCELKAPKSQINKFGGYAYRSLEDIAEAVKPLCEKYKATFIFCKSEIFHAENQKILVENGKFIDCESGETLDFSGQVMLDVSRKGMSAEQLTGSASSYARKYALNGLFAIDDTKDSDFTNTHGKDEPQAKQTQNKPRVQPLSNEQISELSQLIETSATNIGDFLAYFKAYDLASVPYQTAKDMLLKKIGLNKGA